MTAQDRRQELQRQELQRQEIDRARELRGMGWSLFRIGQELGRSKEWLRERAGLR